MRAMDETFSDDVDGFEDGAGWRCACGREAEMACRHEGVINKKLTQEGSLGT